MLHFLEENALLGEQFLRALQQSLFLSFCPPCFGDVAKCQQRVRGRGTSVIDGAGRHQQRAASDLRDIPVELEGRYLRMIRDGCSKTLAQHRDIPLPLIQIKQADPM